MFLLAKNRRYRYDTEAIREPSRYGGPNSPQSIRSPHGQGFTRRADKQRGHGCRHAGFNDHWDGMNRAEQGLRGRNLRDVWTIATQAYPGGDFATFPEALVEPCVLAGCPVAGTVLDPFVGSGTTIAVCLRLGRNAIGIDLNSRYEPLVLSRVQAASLQGGKPGGRTASGRT